MANTYKVPAAFLLALGVAGLALSQPAGAQAPATQPAPEVKKWNNTVPTNRAVYAGKPSAPAPRRDLSGVWDASAEQGFQAKGAFEYPAMRANDPREGIDPDERNIARQLPYTPAGEAALLANRPAAGVRAAMPGKSNDPTDSCEPVGFPRMLLYELRTFQIVQTPTQTIFLNQTDNSWRIVWTDGRALPAEPEPRWNGYSVGRWTVDSTFVVDTVGLDERSWLDYAGRPHSSELRVEETYQRVNHDTLHLTMKITDPPMYREPWLALNKYPIHLQSPDFDMIERICSPAEAAEYNRLIGIPLSQ
jgi:hypothetical protein